MKNFGGYVIAVSVIILLGFMFMSGSKKDNSESTNKSANDMNSKKSIDVNNQVSTTATNNKLIKEITSNGTGEVAKDGDTVFVNYIGKLTDGTEFDNSYKRGQSIEFVLGSGQVIKGWDEGIKGMKIGEKATLTIPPNLGYGERGSPPIIPSNATLIFDVELVKIQ